MQAFHNDPEIKAKYLKRIRHHMKLDHFVQGVTWETNGVTKGCAIGCTFEEYNHQKMVDEWDVPLVLARLEDCIFEGLSKKESDAWPLRFTKAINTGADYSMVWPKFALWLLVDKKNGLSSFIKDENVLKVIEQTVGVYRQWIKTGKPNKNAAYAARAAAKQNFWSMASKKLIQLLKEEK